MTVKTNNFQIGVDATADNNFTLTTPVVPDGTAKLSRGNAGATTQDILTVDADGAVSIETTIPSADNSKKAVTSAWAKFGFAILLAANGYIKFPSWMGGLIVQWGSVVSTAGGGATATWPLAFPVAILAHLGVRYSAANAPNTVSTGTATLTTGNFSVVNTSNAGISGDAVRYIAIGY